MPPIKNIREVTEPLKEQIQKGDVHTIDEMKAWLKPFGLQRYDFPLACFVCKTKKNDRL